MRNPEPVRATRRETSESGPRSPSMVWALIFVSILVSKRGETTSTFRRPLPFGDASLRHV
jgi:hypothetical protein